MKRWGWLLGCLVLALSACQWDVSQNTPPAITKDTLAYTYQNITENKPDSLFLVKIKYPLFKHNKLINDSVQEFIVDHFLFNNPHPADLSQSAKIYLNNYIEALKDRGISKPEDVHFDASVIRQDSSLLTIDLKDPEGYLKKHPFDYYANFNTKSNHRIRLEDILIKNYRSRLDKIGDTIFRKEEKLDNITSLVKNYYFKDGVFTLYDNFLIAPIGLRFIYNPMDIKIPDAGQTEVLIPYSKIKSLLLPHTVISQYIK
jgi:hypothetical protein